MDFKNLERFTNFFYSKCVFLLLSLVSLSAIFLPSIIIHVNIDDDMIFNIILINSITVITIFLFEILCLYMMHEFSFSVCSAVYLLTLASFTVDFISIFTNYSTELVSSNEFNIEVDGWNCISYNVILIYILYIYFYILKYVD